MKTFFSSIAIVAVLALVSFIQVDPLAIGSTLPKSNKKLTDISGKVTTLKEAVGKNGLLVMFSCNTCPVVIKNQERASAICSYAQKNDLGVIVVNSNEANRDSEESLDAMKSYAAEQKYNWQYVVDSESELANAFGANRTPECFLFDKKQKLVYHGAIDNNPGDESSVTRKHLQIAIEELTAGKEIAVKETKSVGCGIKRKG